jgi:LL-diaminopimelate aminotransferase
MIRIQRAERLTKLPPYLFAEIDKMKAEARARGVDIINLGIGDPDQPTPPHIIRALNRAAEDSANHQYPSYEGLLAFRKAVAHWYKSRFQVTLDPEKEVLSLIGSKEGIGHIPLAFIDPGDVVLVPDPGYPVYQAGTVLAGGTPYTMPLLEENRFLPDLDSIPEDIRQKAKLMHLNSPNNPTSAVAPLEYFKKVAEFARRYNIIVCHDAPYSEIYYDGKPPASFMEAPGAKEVGVEFHSLSKTFNMTGWRIGFVVGNPEVLSGLGTVKTNLDSGVFQAVQYAGIEALTASQECVDQMRKMYQERRDVLIEGLQGLGLKVNRPQATFYVWVSVPQGYASTSFTAHLLKNAGIVTTPGNGFGKYGEGYIRMTITVGVDRLKEAVERMKSIL